MSEEAVQPPEKHHCHNCRASHPTRIRQVGLVDFRQCVNCGLWIRCSQCMHIEAAEGHTCPERTEAV